MEEMFPNTIFIARSLGEACVEFFNAEERIEDLLDTNTKLIAEYQLVSIKPGKLVPQIGEAQ